jgi:hypothetical protein
MGKTRKELVSALEAELGVEPGMLLTLRTAADWGFVVQLHALIEGALAFLLEHKLDRPELRTFLGYLPLMGRFGKLTACTALGLLDPRHPKFIEKLTEIRNACVHQVRGTAFTFATHVATPGEKPRLVKLFKPYFSDPHVLGSQNVDLNHMLDTEPKTAFWVVGVQMFCDVYLTKQHAMAIAAEVREFLSNRDSSPRVLARALRKTE